MIAGIVYGIVCAGPRYTYPVRDGASGARASQQAPAGLVNQAFHKKLRDGLGSYRSRAEQQAIACVSVCVCVYEYVGM